MTIVKLSPGKHAVTWTLENHNQITAEINIDNDGNCECLSAVDANCDTSNPPGVIAWKNKVEAYLLKTIAETDFELWIQNNGGTAGIYNNISMVEEILDAYIGSINIGFAVTPNNVYAVVDYYLGV